VRRRLVPHLTGRTMADVEILDYRLTDPELPSAVAARLSGSRIESRCRLGKYLLIELADGAALTVHLRMTGNLLWLAAPPEVAAAVPAGSARCSTTAPSSATRTSAASVPGRWPRTAPRRCWRRQSSVPSPLGDWDAGRTWPGRWPAARRP